MSVQLYTTAKMQNHIFDSLPEDATVTIFEHLGGERSSLTKSTPEDDRSIVNTAIVCKNWRSNPVLIRERASSLTRLRSRINLQHMHQQMRIAAEYPQEIQAAFRAAGRSIIGLPELDLAGRIGSTGYIDFISPQDMLQSVMRFRDRHGRPGIALKIRAMHPPEGREQRAENVLAIFKRHLNPENITWTRSWGDSNQMIERLYNNRHNENGHIGNQIAACPTCPFVGNPLNAQAMLLPLLRNQDPDFILAPNAVQRNQTSRKAIIVAALALLLVTYFARSMILTNKD